MFQLILYNLFFHLFLIYILIYILLLKKKKMLNLNDRIFFDSVK